MEYEEIYPVIPRLNQETGSRPLPKDEVKNLCKSVSGYPVGRHGTQDVLIGGAVAGTNPVTKQQTATQTIDLSKWQEMFRPVGELESGEVQMLIDGFLPEGVTCIGALPAEGKTLFALSIAKAPTTGEDFLGEICFPVPQVVPVVYLIPESGARAFRRRCEKLRIPSDRSRFLCRTISEGSTILLDDPFLIR
jgi:AAA domain